MKKAICLLITFIIILNLVVLGTVYAEGDSLVAALHAERSLLEVTFSEAVTSPAVLLYNCVDNPTTAISGLTPVYDAPSLTLNVSFGSYRIPLNTLHKITISYNDTQSETRFFILKKLIEDYFDYASTADL